ncbi:START domain-containing protein [Pseudomonas citronellolis]|uniref:START domain-containing protein n=1 Tax=Pseudomonas citronellolis TaxID=53408 RepID=UPI0023E44858|nr:START domain-containing protein [Pseudomonas citronellolis]MDF3935802.1 START domain-containing protein [Pseudomonas citronellolis]
MKRLLLGLLLCVAAAQAPAQDSWRLAREEDGIRVYLSPVPGSKYQSYRGVVDIRANVQTLADLQENLRVACKWLYSCAELRLLKASGDDVWLYMRTALPWPARSRDLVLRISTERTADGGLLRRIQAVPDYLPPVPGQIRVPILAGLWSLAPLADGRTRVVYQMRAEPGGSVPSWLANDFVVDAPLDTLRTLRAVAERQGPRAP